jgi:hypothetical protein
VPGPHRTRLTEQAFEIESGGTLLSSGHEI